MWYSCDSCRCSGPLSTCKAKNQVSLRVLPIMSVSLTRHLQLAWLCCTLPRHVALLSRMKTHKLKAMVGSWSCTDLTNHHNTSHVCPVKRQERPQNKALRASAPARAMCFTDAADLLHVSPFCARRSATSLKLGWIFAAADADVMLSTLHPHKQH